MGTHTHTHTHTQTHTHTHTHTHPHTHTHRTHRTLYPQLLDRKNMDALYFFGLHTWHTLHTLHTLPTSVQTTKYDRIICVYYFHLHTSHTPHTLPTPSRKKKYGCYLLFSPAHTAHPTYISPNQPL